MAAHAEMRPVVGLGAGGHARVVIDTLRALGGWDVVALLDRDPALAGTTILGVRVLGDDGKLGDVRADGVRHAFVGVGSVGDATVRRRLYELARRQGFELVAAVHPRATIAPSAEVGDGPTIMAGAIVNAAARLGDNVIVNTGAIVEHDCVVASHVHIATGARLASTVTIGEGAHVGIGAAVRQGIRIGRNAIVGAGAVVVDDVAAGAVVVGVPARPLRRAVEA
jgi:sugar O-acyltransferase (sialic acid O-acetyltransferase NeuD family)